MKLYIGYEFKASISSHIKLSDGGICFIASTLKQMQKRVDAFGDADKEYLIYKINPTSAQVADILDNLINECLPPNDKFEVINGYTTGKGHKIQELLLKYLT